MITLKHHGRYHAGHPVPEVAAIIFLKQNRPINFAKNKKPQDVPEGTALADIAWRRIHKTPDLTDDELEMIYTELEARGINPNMIEYSRMAGCQMCPCSPGFLVYDQDWDNDGAERFDLERS